MELIRKSPQLAGIDHTVFDGLPPGGQQPLDPRDEFYVCTAMIQLMEESFQKITSDPENLLRPGALIPGLGEHIEEEVIVGGAPG